MKELTQSQTKAISAAEKQSSTDMLETFGMGAFVGGAIGYFGAIISHDPNPVGLMLKWGVGAGLINTLINR